MVMFPIAASERLGMKRNGKSEPKKKIEHVITFPAFEHC